MTDEYPHVGLTDRTLRYAGLGFAVLSLVVVSWGLFDDRDAIVLFGLISFGFGVVMDRLEGPFKFGPSGLEGNLKAVERAIKRKVEELPLDEDQKRELEERLLGQATSRVLTGSAIIRAPAGGAKAGGIPPMVEIAAVEFAEGLVAQSIRVLCANGHELDEAPDLLPEERPPCPKCGSRDRRFEVKLGGSVRPTGEVTVDDSSEAS